MNPFEARTCPFPIQDYPQVLLAHGGGGRMMNQLIEKMFGAHFDNQILAQRHDAAFLPKPSGRIAFSTDSYVISPIFFPGGSIGDLAVNGTVNDLAMAGARPLYISCGFILEEGLPMVDLQTVVQSMALACKRANVQVVTGDTKVVERGKCDGLYINTSGIGVIEHEATIAPQSVLPGDVILLNGDLGRHGMAVMALRESLSFETTITSDTASLADMVLDLLTEGVRIHCMRDLTRGGLASATNEIAQAANVKLQLFEDQIPVAGEVSSACEMLGLDPLYVANEGRCMIIVPEGHAQKALAVMSRHGVGRQSTMIGNVQEAGGGQVVIRTRLGINRIVDMISGEQLPRIC